ncbi:NFACT family protein, partial [Staphylococcus hominis]|uniref:NFACT family protein n=1 Tax=Staphylococcus hominis TaxID=1290 RepID=UPI0010EAA775
KLNPFEITGQQTLKYIDFNAGKIAKQLLNTFEGFSPLISNEIVQRRQFMTNETLPLAYDEVMQQTYNQPQPIFHKNHETGKEDFYFMPLLQFSDDVSEYASLHELLDRYFDARGERDRVKQRANDLVRFVHQQLNKNEHKLSKLMS